LFLAVSVFVLSVKMHERYLFPALAMAMGSFLASGDRRALWLFAGLSVTEFLNVGQVLALSGQEVYLVPARDPMLLAVSTANVLMWLAIVSIGLRRGAGHTPGPFGSANPAV